MSSLSINCLSSQDHTNICYCLTVFLHADCKTFITSVYIFHVSLTSFFSPVYYISSVLIPFLYSIPLISHCAKMVNIIIMLNYLFSVSLHFLVIN